MSPRIAEPEMPRPNHSADVAATFASLDATEYVIRKISKRMWHRIFSNAVDRMQNKYMTLQTMGLVRGISGLGTMEHDSGERPNGLEGEWGGSDEPVC